MKAKLLRKVRKEFSIISHPNGLQKDQTFLHINTYCQTITLNMGNQITDYCVVNPDDNKEYRLTGVQYFKTEKEAVAWLHSIMLWRVLSRYSEHGTRRIAKRNIANKLYFNENITNK